MNRLCSYKLGARGAIGSHAAPRRPRDRGGARRAADVQRCRCARARRRALGFMRVAHEGAPLRALPPRGSPPATEGFACIFGVEFSCRPAPAGPRGAPGGARGAHRGRARTRPAGRGRAGRGGAGPWRSRRGAGPGPPRGAPRRAASCGRRVRARSKHEIAHESIGGLRPRECSVKTGPQDRPESALWRAGPPAPAGSAARGRAAALAPVAERSPPRVLWRRRRAVRRRAARRLGAAGRAARGRSNRPGALPRGGPRLRGAARARVRGRGGLPPPVPRGRGVAAWPALHVACALGRALVVWDAVRYGRVAKKCAGIIGSHLHSRGATTRRGSARRCAGRSRSGAGQAWRQGGWGGAKAGGPAARAAQCAVSERRGRIARRRAAGRGAPVARCARGVPA